MLSGVYSGCIFAGPYYLMVAARLGASDLLISGMIAAPFLGSMCAMFLANTMEGRPKMPFAVYGWTGGRIILLLMALAISPVWYALIIFASQLIASIPSPAYAAIMKDVYPDEHRGRIMGYVRVLSAAVTIVITLIVGKLLDNNIQSFHWIFPVGGLFGIAAALVFGRIITSQPTKSEIVGKKSTSHFLGKSFGLLVHDHGFRWFTISVLAYGLGNLLAAPVYPKFMVNTLKITNFEAGLLSMITSVCWMVAFVYWGRYVDVRSPLKATVINILLAVMVPLNFVVASYCRSPWILIPQAAAAGISNAGIELSYFNSVFRFAGEERLAHYQALFAFMVGVRGCFALFGGVLTEVFLSHHWDLRYIFLIAAIVMLSGAWMQAIGMKRVARGSYKNA